MDLTRRTVLAAGAAVAATPLLAGNAQAAPPASGLVADPLLHLLRRTTYGLTPALVREARTLGPARWLDQQLAPERLDDHVCDAVVRRFPSVAMTAAQVAEAYRGREWEAAQELVRATIVRAAWSRRQLLEVMVEFWSDHLNITCPSDDVVGQPGTARPRRRSGGTRSAASATCSVASAHQPGDAALPRRRLQPAAAPNENYGRELLELHTVGVDAGYTEADVKVERPAAHRLHRRPRHPARSATAPTGTTSARCGVLGFTHANATRRGRAGRRDGLPRATSPRTRPPPAGSRASSASASSATTRRPRWSSGWRRSTWRTAPPIVPVLRALFATPEFAASVGQKTRRPFEDLVATLRALGIGPEPDGGTEALEPP